MSVKFSRSLVCLMSLFAGCSLGTSSWPPAPRTEQEQQAIDKALAAVRQYDGWPEVACVAESRGRAWRVQAWKIVNPKATGKSRCVPWAVRSISIDERGVVVGYANRL